MHVILTRRCWYRCWRLVWEQAPAAPGCRLCPLRRLQPSPTRPDLSYNCRPTRDICRPLGNRWESLGGCRWLLCCQGGAPRSSAPAAAVSSRRPRWRSPRTLCPAATRSSWHVSQAYPSCARRPLSARAHLPLRSSAGRRNSSARLLMRVGGPSSAAVQVRHARRGLSLRGRFASGPAWDTFRWR